jgi:hypothetical protein
MECVGFAESALSAEQKARAQAFVASQAEGDLLTLRLYPNVDFTNDESVGSGMMAIFNPSATVDASILSDSLFQIMSVIAIPSCNGPAKLNDQYFASCAKSVLEAVDQFPVQPPRMEVRVAKNNAEREVWAPELGGQGSFAGVFSKIDAENHRLKNYYVAARGTVPLIATDIRRRIAAEKPTYREMLNQPEWAKLIGYGTTTARRNIQRTMHNVAEACAVEIVQKDDLWPALKNPNHAPPVMTEPDWEQQTYAIREITYQGKPAVALCYGVVPAADCLNAQEKRFFVVSSPYDGIAMYELNNFAAVNAAIALPADTGRMRAVSELVGKKFDVASRTDGLVWEGDAKMAHPDLHPEAYKPMGAAFKEVMTSYGWAERDVIERLIPVAVKVWNDSLVRT